MSKKSLFERYQGRLFTPRFSRQNKKSSSILASNLDKDLSLTSTDFKNTNIESSSSFRYGDKPYLVSTQQLRVDWSRFENHTFFHSAVANVNESFDKIVNFYPFDKSKKKIEIFEDNLTGFEKYVLQSFPKNVGYLVFSGTSMGEALTNGTQITVKDRSGVSINELSDASTGAQILDPMTSPFSIEFFIKVPQQSNNNQVVFQKKRTTANNITVALSGSSSSTECEVHFAITSGSNFLHVSGTMKKGTFHHVTAMYDRIADQRCKLLIDNQIHSSSQQLLFDNLEYNSADFKIGSGDTIRLGTSIFTNEQTFSGSIDELRYFHSVESIKKIQKRKNRSFYPGDNDPTLKLYYKFNEPYGTYTGNDIVLDSSGNSLHERITNFNITNRQSGSDNPVLSEELERNPVLFPTFPNVSALNTRLLSSASNYDNYNPNLITQLIPKHYFQDGSNFNDFNTELEKLGASFTTMTTNRPGSGKSELPNSQLLIKLLLTYAKFFDELKLFVDAFTSYRHVSYEDFDTTPDAMLKEVAKMTNTTLPYLFTGADVAQYIVGLDLANNKVKAIKSLNEVQNLIWRRILSEAPKMNLRKGTVDSIKSVFRSSGIEPDNIITFREYGGSKRKSLNASRELKRDVFRFLSFTGSLGKITTAVDANGYPTNAGIPRIKSGFLSGSRIQSGTPKIRGTFVSSSLFPPNGISNNPSDGLFTSGSFTYEGLYDWENGYQSINESLIRLHVTGNSAPSNKESCIANVVASNTQLNLYVSDSTTDQAVKRLVLTGVNVFDKDIWHISFGKKAGHDLKTTATSSYFLRAAKQENGDIVEQYYTASFFEDRGDSVFKNVSSQYNTSGSFLVIGSQSFQQPGSNLFLNANAVTSNAKVTNFHGFVANQRFYSKNTKISEFINRAKNYDSYGVEDPKVNYNFAHANEGSFERLVLHTDSKQATTSSSATGTIRIFDFSKNNLHFNGSNFDTNSRVKKNFRVNFEILSDKFDLNFTREKIRVRSFQDSENLEQSYFSTIAPLHEVLPSEESMDDNRLSLDMSVMRGLNENMLRMFNNFDALDDALGRPNLLFAENYQDLRHLREVYFNNVLEVLNLQKYRELFKWIDNSFTDVVYSLIPRTTNFLGINFVYESHVLERNRFRYYFDEIYLKSGERDPETGNIFLSQFVAYINRM